MHDKVDLLAQLLQLTTGNTEHDTLLYRELCGLFTSMVMSYNSLSVAGRTSLGDCVGQLRKEWKDPDGLVFDLYEQLQAKQK
jgi:hypothetical protein